MHIEQYPANLLNGSLLISMLVLKNQVTMMILTLNPRQTAKSEKAISSLWSILKQPGPPTTSRYVWEVSWKIPNNGMHLRHPNMGGVFTGPQN